MKTKLVSKSASKLVETGSFEKLKVWQKGQELTVRIYRTSKSFPKSELFGLTNQLRRAILSVPTNIAESQGRYTYADRVNFLITARGSLHEVRSLVKTSSMLGYLDGDEALGLEIELAGLTAGLNGLISSIRGK